MALTRITKGVIKPNENYDTHNINSTGIVTTIGLDVNGNGDISGNLSVGGVLTYEDVTSIDSVGIITAQKDIHVGAGISVVGVGTFGSLDISGDIDVDGHTNLDNVSVAGVSTFSDDINIPVTNKKLIIGASGQLQLYNQGYHSRIDHVGNHWLDIRGNAIALQDASNNYYFDGRQSSGSARLFFSNNPKLETTNTGINVTGNVVSDGADIDGDLDVDGHTNLDNVSVAGVVTATSFVGALPITGDTNNRVITATGSGGLNGEANLTFSGHILGLHQPSPDGINYVLDVVGGALFTKAGTFSSGDFNKGQLTIRNTTASQGAFLDFRAASSSGAMGVIAKIGGYNPYSGNGYDGVLTFSTRQQSTNTMVERLRITSLGKVGIDNASPDNKLSVYDVGYCGLELKSNRSTATDNIGGLHFKTQSTNVAYIQSLVDGTIKFRNSSSLTERLRITSAGNLLIGKIADSGKPLEVYQAGDAAIRIQNNASGTGGNDGLLFEIGSSSKDALIWNYESANMRFGTAGTERLRITSNGKVGVGVDPTNYPGKFVVSGDALICDRDIHSRVANTVANSDRGFKQDIDGTEKLHLYADNSSDVILENNGGDERLRITSGGKIIVGHTAALNEFHGPYGTTNRNPQIQINGTNISNASLSITSWDNNVVGYYGAGIFLARSGSSTKGTNGRVTNLNTILGSIIFSGDDGTDFVKGAMIQAAVDTSTGDNDMPARLQFLTTPDGAQEPIERLRIASTGELGLGLTQNPPTGSFTMRLTETPEFNIYSTQHAQNNNCKINFGVGQSASVSGNTGARVEMNIPNSGGQMTGELKFHTNSGDNLQERLRIKSDGKVVIGNINGSGTGALTIFPNSITGNGRLDVYGGGDENSQTQSRCEVMRIGRGDILDQYYHSIWSATGSGGATSHFLKFYVSNGTAGATNQVEALSMNGVGQISMPSQPSFLAEHTHAGGNYKQKGELYQQFIRNFQRVRHNTGNCYSNSTGKFTAPSDGTYLFHIDFTMDGGDGADDSAGCYFRVENNSTYYNRVHSGGRDFHSVNPRLHSTSTGYEINASFQTIEKLAAGATVGWFFTDWDFTGTRITTCFFSGYKVG